MSQCGSNLYAWLKKIFLEKEILQIEINSIHTIPAKAPEIVSFLTFTKLVFS
jgi:hypothetical protein